MRQPSASRWTSFASPRSAAFPAPCMAMKSRAKRRRRRCDWLSKRRARSGAPGSRSLRMLRAGASAGPCRVELFARVHLIRVLVELDVVQATADFFDLPDVDRLDDV